MVEEIFKALKGQRFNLMDEKILQGQIEKVFSDNSFTFRREHHLDEENKNIIDFLVYEKYLSGSVGIEIKIKGSKMNIYKQCERYCNFEDVGKLILVTNKAVRLPLNINTKQCYVFNLSKAWL